MNYAITDSKHVNFCVSTSLSNSRKTSMMWPSQNFLLCNETIIKIKVNEWINNLKKNMLRQSPPPFGDTYNLYKL